MATQQPKNLPPMLKPLFTWAGGKRKVIPKYRALSLLPPYKQFDAYVEPFFGGGAIFCDAVNSGFLTDFGFHKEFAINDINTEMMFVYYWIREAPEEFLKVCQRLLRQRNKLVGKEARKAWYYELRKKYWGMVDLKLYDHPNPKTMQTAATLYVLMKTSFNGIWKTVEDQKKPEYGKFGGQCGLPKDVLIDRAQILAWSNALQRARLFNGSYRDMVLPKTNCLIYVDPPYRASTIMYGRSFDDNDQRDLVEWCIEKSIQNYTVIFANRHLADNFFKLLFRHNEDEYHHFEHKYIKGTIGHELLVILEPERLKRHQMIINGKVVTFSVKLLVHLFRQNPIIREFGITGRGFFEATRGKFNLKG